MENKWKWHRETVEAIKAICTEQWRTHREMIFWANSKNLITDNEMSQLEIYWRKVIMGE